MALHDPSEKYDEALDRLTGEKAFMILSALKGGQPLNTLDMIEHLDVYLGDEQALGELVKQTAQGKNAFGELLQKVMLEIAEQQARADLAEAPKRRREQAAEDRYDGLLWHRAA